MNISTLELIQATIEIMGIVLCFISICAIVLNGKNRLAKYLIALFVSSILLLFFDAVAYISRGNTDAFNVTLNHLCNYGVFVMNIVTLFFGSFFTGILYDRCGITIKKMHIALLHTLFLLAGVLVALNPVFHWLFYFDDNNYYHRNTLWLLYAALLVFCLLFTAIGALIRRKRMHKKSFIAILAYTLTPIIFTLIQAAFYGFSLTNIGVAFGLFVTLIMYFFQLENEKRSAGRSFYIHRTILISVFLMILIVVCMSFSLITCLSSIKAIVMDYSISEINLSGVIFQTVAVFVTGLILIGVAFVAILMKEQKTMQELIDNKMISKTDALTGMLNRLAYEQDLEKLRGNYNKETLKIVMMDINGLKTVNDTVGHQAGDELIIGASRCIQHIFEPLGKIYRVGGDEFIAFLNCSSDQIQDACDRFDIALSNWSSASINELSISKGLASASDFPDASLDELQKIADKRMYQEKNNYYRMTGKDRRMTW